MLRRTFLILLIPVLLWSGAVRTAQGPGPLPAARSATSLPVEMQLNQLREQVLRVQSQLSEAKREIADLRARYQRHGHTYTAPGNYSGINADALVAKGSIHYGRGLVLLGGSGTPGNTGPLYRTFNTRTSGPVE